ncbi:hypothetical protein [Nocardia sp. BMG51109]|uniref:hypothetical protein n=1 Tax=Nocardia sp. BMG51109 TaxID=1056816 RepID=UPI000465A5F3|nr:hypothetical protein [Nocardia sp. BMG51109]
MAVELDTPPESGFDSLGEIELRLSRIGAGDIHGSIDEIACAAADMGGEYFYVTDSLGARITAAVYRRSPRPRRRRPRFPALRGKSLPPDAAWSR